MKDAARTTRATQLWLFPPPKPFNLHPGPEFFRSLPRAPGVYFFLGEDDRILYIGKAKSLRERLNSYRYVHPDRDARKTWRLVNETSRIEFEVCASHREALLLESRLLREHRPRFNRANVWPWSAVYIGLDIRETTLRLQVDRTLHEGCQWFGAFKAFAIPAFSALQRTLRYVADPAAAPLGWFEWDCTRSFEVERTRVDEPALHDFLAGRCPRFLTAVEEARAADCTEDLARQNLVLNDLVLLEQFYEKGPRRVREMQTDTGLVSPEELADWLAASSA